MPKYKTREQLFKASQTTDEQIWNEWIHSLTQPSGTIKVPLYHLSFKKDLPRQVIPQEVFSAGGDVHEIYNEPLPPRLSTSSSVLGCWRGIYANFSDKFERDHKRKEITAYVYKVIPNTDTRVLTPSRAHREWLLYDAHNTGRSWPHPR